MKEMVMVVEKDDCQRYKNEIMFLARCNFLKFEIIKTHPCTMCFYSIITPQVLILPKR